MKNINWEFVLFGVGAVIGVLILIGLMSWITMFLWNSVLVIIFPTLPKLTYWLAVGVYVILAILFNRN